MANNVKILLAVLAFLYSNSTLAANLKEIIGIDQQELEKCQTNEDCIVTHSFAGCCMNVSFNKKYQDIIKKNQKALWDKLTPKDRQKYCSLVECDVAEQKAVCKQSKCELVDK